MGEEQTKDERHATNDTQPCAICLQTIPRGANYCTHCENYQSWHRRLLAGIDIQALITLVPIATLAFVFIKEQLVEPVAQLQLVSLDCADDRVEMAVANVGGLDAVFSGATLRSENQTAIPLRFEAGVKRELLVKAGQTRIYQMYATDEQGASLGLGLSRDRACHYRIQARAAAFKNTAKSDSPICACPTD